MKEETRDSAVLALALARLDGVGRVTAGRLTHRFESADELRATPREQILVRLPGIPSADQIVARIQSTEFDTHLSAAAEQVDLLSDRRITVLTSNHPAWPTGFDDLDWAQRPAHLFVFGDPRQLTRAEVAFLAAPPLEPRPYEAAQSLARRLLQAGVSLAVGMNPGFDTVACKFAVEARAPVVLVAASGLARVPGPMRPAAAAAAKVGGVMVSSFDMTHGPFDHDHKERALVMAAMARTVVLVGVHPPSADVRAAEWARGNGRTVIDLTGPHGDHPLDQLVAMARPTAE